MSDNWHLLLPIVLFVLIAVFRITRALFQQKELQKGMQYGISELVRETPPTPPEPTDWQRFQFFWKRAFGSRAANRYEFRNRFRPDTWDIETIFFCPRLPLKLTITLESEKVPTVKALSIDMGEGYQPSYFTWKISSEANLHTITLKTYLSESVEAVSVALANTDDEFEYRCGCKLEVEPYADYAILREAYKYLAEGRREAAMEYFHKYENFSRNNPWVCLDQADYYVSKKDWLCAQQAALMAIVNGQSKPSSDIYGYARESRGFETSRETIDELVLRESQWSLDSNVGFSVLREKREITCGLNGFHLTRQHQIFRVRRAAAARFISRIGFDITPQDEILLHSGMRVLRANGQITKVETDNFTFTDADSRNAAITTKQEKQAVWILPDLYSGDVVEWTSDVLTRDSYVNEKPWPFTTANLFSYSYPTLEGTIDVIAHGEFEPVFYHTHPEVISSSEEELSDGTRAYHFTGEKYIPARNSGFDFGNLLLNPRTGLAPRDQKWKTVANSIRIQLLGRHADEDKVPEEIKALLENHETDRAKLEAVFYWIRDKLKYGVFHKSHAMIGKSNRAEAIVKSGFADCKDRSYLLHLTCRELGIENNFYMTSSKYGSTIEELPADQFDHVSLRAKVDGKWLYLDPTNTNCLFGSVPFWYQAMKSLILDDEGSIIALPDDEPQQNLVVIREVLDRMDDGWVAGSFFIRSRGQTARLFEEHWKLRTLYNDSRLSAAQQSIEAFMPRVIIDRFDQLASTSEGDTFTVSGVCRRARCNMVGDQRVAAIEWGLPVLPVEMWRGFEFATMFAFRFPLVVEIDIEIANSLAGIFREHSTTDQFTGRDLEISEHCERRGDAIAIHRTVTVKHKFLHGESVKTELPQFFEALEKALSLTCVFER